MSEYTPGPWIYDGDQGLIEDAEGSIIADAFGYSLDDGMLIAAAPELLEALQELVELVEDAAAGKYQIDSLTTQPARMAIKRAKGE